MKLCAKHRHLDLSTPVVMGILNVTPNSFFDGGQFESVDDAVSRALHMVEEGAAIIDIGGESSGPGTTDVSIDEECSRVIPVIEALRKASDIFISVDTYKAAVADQALKAGADMVNDILAGRGDNSMFDVIAQHNAAYCMMYSKNDTARTTKDPLDYNNVVQTIYDFLAERVQCAKQAGIPLENICVDPGMGWFISGKAEYSIEVLKRLREFSQLELPILIGTSRKSFIGAILDGKGPGERLEGTLVTSAAAVMHGASIIRGHDVKELVRAVRVAFHLTEK